MLQTQAGVMLPHVTNIYIIIKYISQQIQIKSKIEPVTKKSKNL